MPLRGIIFDFDGLILDTELPVYTAWQELYSQFGQVLPLNVYAQCLGSDEEAFHPLDYLESLVQQKLDRVSLLQTHKQREMSLLLEQEVFPGVLETIFTAKKLGLSFAIASSSDRKWVTTNLKRLGLINLFPWIITADEVRPVKPAPNLFLAALAEMNISPDEAVVLEDSPNGILAARAAGIFVIAIPNTLSIQLDISKADMILPSMVELDLYQLMQLFAASGTFSSQ